MQVFQNMDMNTFVLVVPTALFAMYGIIALQKHLSFKDNPYTGLIVPGICMLAATILAVRPLFILDIEGGLIWFCLKMWFVFNVPTVVFLFPYFKGRQNAKQMKAYAEAQVAAETEVASESAEEAAEEVK